MKYTGFRDRPIEERQVRFHNGCREGHTEIAFAATGTNLQLVFGVSSGNFAGDPRECDFDKEHGKVRDSCARFMVRREEYRVSSIEKSGENWC